MSINLNNGIKGRTDGSAVAAGYVGEKISATISATILTYPTTQASVASLSLTAGVWMLYGGISIYTDSLPSTGLLFAGWTLFNSTDSVAVTELGYLHEFGGASGNGTIKGLYPQGYVNISATKTIQLRLVLAVGSGSPTNGAVACYPPGAGASGEFFYAVRIA